jgi:hypothetical protein
MSSPLKALRTLLQVLTATLLLPWSAAAQQQTSSAFIANAFAAVGISVGDPTTNAVTCPQVSLANDSVFGIPDLGTRVREARRFVTTLFEAPASYDGLVPYTESETYAVRNGQALHDDSTFAQDLYAAFLQRPADPGGVAFWAGQVGANGRHAVLAAFGGSTEFSNLVSGLNVLLFRCPVACPGSRTHDANGVCTP